MNNSKQKQSKENSITLWTFFHYFLIRNYFIYYLEIDEYSSMKSTKINKKF